MTSVDSNGVTDDREDLVVVKDLVKHFEVRAGRSKEVVRAVDGVSFSIKRGETLGVVGESGCGKSTTARLMLRLIEATSGSVTFEGQEIMNLPSRQMRELRQEMQIVFQDPYASLNPRMTVADIVGEGPRVWKTIRMGRSGIPTSSQAANVSGSASPAPWRCNRN